MLLRANIINTDARIQQAFAARSTDAGDLRLQTRLDQRTGERGEEVDLVRSHQDGDRRRGLGGLARGGALLQTQQDIVEVAGGRGEDVLLADGGGVDHVDDGLELGLVVGAAGELRHGEVAQLAMAGGVDEEELCVGAAGVVVVAEAGLGLAVAGGRELDGLGALGGVGRRGGVAALEEGEEGGLAGAGGPEEEHGGEGGVGRRLDEDEVQQDGEEEDDGDAD